MWHEEGVRAHGCQQGAPKSECMCWCVNYGSDRAVHSTLCEPRGVSYMVQCVRYGWQVKMAEIMIAVPLLLLVTSVAVVVIVVVLVVVRVPQPATEGLAGGVGWGGRGPPGGW